MIISVNNAFDSEMLVAEVFKPTPISTMGALRTAGRAEQLFDSGVTTSAIDSGPIDLSAFSSLLIIARNDGSTLQTKALTQVAYLADGVTALATNVLRSVPGGGSDFIAVGPEVSSLVGGLLGAAIVTPLPLSARFTLAANSGTNSRLTVIGRP